MGRFNRWSPKVIGSYHTEYWPYVYDYTAKQYIYTPVKPEYRLQQVARKTGSEPDPDWPGHTRDTFVVCDEDEIINAPLTNKNCAADVRQEQAAILTARGYHGPVSGGEARVLKALFIELGQPDLVKHGWIVRNIEIPRRPTAYQRRWAHRNNVPVSVTGTYQTKRLQNCYVFKSPIDAIPFDKFVKLARMYKDDSKKLRKAVLAVMANPDAHKEIETIDAMEILGNLTTEI